MGVGEKTNNPGNLLAGVKWQGVTGVYSANGLNYAVFDTPQHGVDALVTDIKSAIGKGFNTLASFVYHYLGTSTDNRDNPNVANYLKTVERSTGLSASSKLSPDMAATIAEGISKAEGTYQSFKSVFSHTGNTSDPSSTSQSSDLANIVPSLFSQQQSQSATDGGKKFLGLNWGNIFAIFIGAGLLLVAVWAIANTSKTQTA